MTNPVYGTKTDLFNRIMTADAKRKHAEWEKTELERQMAKRREGMGQAPVKPLPTPKEPTELEKEEHELRGHNPPAAWCPYCIMGCGTEAAHATQPYAHEDKRGPQIEIDYLHMKADGTFFLPGEVVVYADVFATHVLAIDKGNGRCNFQCVSGKGYEGPEGQSGIKFGAKLVIE